MAHLPRSLNNVAADLRVCASTKASITIGYDTFGTLNAAKTNMIVLNNGLGANRFMYTDEFCEALATPGAFTSALYGIAEADFAGRTDEDLERIKTHGPPPPRPYEKPDEEGFFVVRYDSRDTGHSTKFDSFGTPNIVKAYLVPEWLGGPVKPVYTLDDMAADAAALVPFLGAEKAHFLGMSMGGMTTQLVAINHPERVFSISSCVSSTGAKDVADSTLWDKTWFLMSPASEAPEDVIAFRVKWLEGFGCSKESLTPAAKAYNELSARRQAQHSGYNGGMGRHVTAILVAPSRDEKLKAVKCPALVYHGLCDRVLPSDHGVRTAEVLPEATFVVEPTLGHVPTPAFLPRLLESVGSVARKGVGMAALLAEPQA